MVQFILTENLTINCRKIYIFILIFLKIIIQTSAASTASSAGTTTATSDLQTKNTQLVKNRQAAAGALK